MFVFHTISAFGGEKSNRDGDFSAIFDYSLIFHEQTIKFRLTKRPPGRILSGKRNGADMKNVNDYQGSTDNEQIEAAIRDRRDGVVLIPPRRSERDPKRTWWLLDRAVLLPENTTVIIENCRIKLSDSCRDNFFRSANCGFGMAEPEPISNIHIRGVGSVVLEGADHPRATGDGSKILACPCPKNFTGAKHPSFEDLHRHSYGTDAGKPGKLQRGDWRNIGILFANADHVSIENLKIVEQHA